VVWNSVSSYLPIFGFRGLFNSSQLSGLMDSKILPKSALPSICQTISGPRAPLTFGGCRTVPSYIFFRRKYAEE